MLPRGYFLALGLCMVLVAAGFVDAQGYLGTITSELGDINTEVRTGMFPAISAILGALVLIGVAAGVVGIITRRS